ncbi:MAG: DUF1016 family protein [Gammaproteobacteria bacterium]|nr:DUF1016 family protein [Gammaproteobacteria bacterium]
MNTTTLKHSERRINTLYERASEHINNARQRVLHTVNNEQVKAYWLIGRDIVAEEQQEANRAKYGSFLLEELSKRLAKKFGKGFGRSTLADIRQFYLVTQKVHAVRGQSAPEFKSNLGWTHYRSLMRITKPEARAFYEIEASKNAWSARELDRQIGSLLFDRLAKSKDKQGLLDLTTKGQEITSPSDAMKDPVVLEFLNIPESHKLTESELEEKLITNLQKFLLELGSGFAFVARQQRLTIEDQYFYADLVFYHTILKCYVLIDLKTHALTHADLGQMQLYRNYYDIECRHEGDNPTVGLILCTKKRDKMVRYFLANNDNNIFASQYQLYLPTEQELEDELQKEIKDIKED